MALRFIDSMGDHMTNGQATYKWTSTNSPSRVVGVHGYAMAGSFFKGMLFPTNTLIMEMYFKPIVPATTLFWTYDDGRSVYGSPTQQNSIFTTQDGAIRCQRYGGGTGDQELIGQTDPDLVRQNTWYHFGWKVFLHATAGYIEARLNGQTVLNVTGVKTIQDIGAPATYWSGQVGGFGVGTNAGNSYYDDVVVMDDVADGIDDPRLGGGGFTKFLGPVQIIVKRPNQTVSAGWTPGGAADASTNVDDTDPDDDTTTNSADNTQVNATDLFEMEDLPPTQDVIAVQSLVLSRKTDDGIAAVGRVVQQGATTLTTAPFYVPKTYSYLITPEPKTPAGGIWDRATWNAIRYGYKRLA